MLMDRRVPKSDKNLRYMTFFVKFWQFLVDEIFIFWGPIGDFTPLYPITPLTIHSRKLTKAIPFQNTIKKVLNFENLGKISLFLFEKRGTEKRRKMWTIHGHFQLTESTCRRWSVHTMYRKKVFFFCVSKKKIAISMAINCKCVTFCAILEGLKKRGRKIRVKKRRANCDCVDWIRFIWEEKWGRKWLYREYREE